MSKFYDPDGNEITLQQWARDFEMPRHIADEQVGSVRVSTVWLGLDHNFLGVGPPLIFETMVFGGEHDQYQRRYHTRHQALTGHDQIAAAIRDGNDPDEGDEP